MKYFNPSYWFKLWVLSAPLFNDKTQGINAKSIDNKKIKDWASNNTSLESINEVSYTNSSINYQPYNLNQLNESSNQNINPFYQTYLDSLASEELETNIHKYHHEKSRHKRQDENKKIKKIRKGFLIQKNSSNLYMDSLNEVITQLIDLNITRRVFPDLNINTAIFATWNRTVSDNWYILIPVNLINENNRVMNLVYRADNLYLDGFIRDNNYFHFNFSRQNQSIINRMNNGGLIPNLRWINSSFNYIQFNNIGPDYRDMLSNRFNYSINWRNIYHAFQHLFNIDQNNAENSRNYDETSRSLFTVILVTSEILRFRNLTDIINNEIVIRNETIQVNRNQTNRIYHTLVMWGNETRDVLNTMRELIRNSTSIRRNGNFLLNVPVNNIPEILREPRIRILIGYMQIPNITFACNNVKKRSKRSINDRMINYWYDDDKFCNLKTEIKKIQGEVITLKILDEINQGGNLKTGDIYLGTTNGIYLIYSNVKVDKFKNLNFPISDIKFDKLNGIYIANKQNEIYYLNLSDLKYKKINCIETNNFNKEINIYFDQSKTDQFITKRFIGDAQLSIPTDVWSEGFSQIKTYVFGAAGGVAGGAAGTVIGGGAAGGAVFTAETAAVSLLTEGAAAAGTTTALVSNPVGWTIAAGTVIGAGAGATIVGWEKGHEKHKEFIEKTNNQTTNIDPNNCDFNINLKNLLDYKKIKILYDNYENIYTKVTKGSIGGFIDEYYGDKITKCFDGNFKENLNCKLMDKSEKHWLTNSIYFNCKQSIEVKIKRNNNFKIDFKIKQSAWNEPLMWANDGEMKMGIGKGIRLYNDDNTFETQIANPNNTKDVHIHDELRKKRSYTISEDKWTDEFTKFINHEQHLPIDNKTNFVTSNITSL